MSELPATSSRLFEDIRAILRDARGIVYTAANAAMVDAYWRIGRRIVEEEQGGAARAEYGSQLIRHLARALGEEFGGGMSVANLRNFRQFYLIFPDAGKRYALRSELRWTHWRLVMRVENPCGKGNKAIGSFCAKRSVSSCAKRSVSSCAKRSVSSCAKPQDAESILLGAQ